MLFHLILTAVVARRAAATGFVLREASVHFQFALLHRADGSVPDAIAHFARLKGVHRDSGTFVVILSVKVATWKNDEYYCLVSQDILHIVFHLLIKYLT